MELAWKKISQGLPVSLALLFGFGVHENPFHGNQGGTAASCRSVRKVSTLPRLVQDFERLSGKLRPSSVNSSVINQEPKSVQSDYWEWNEASMCDRASYKICMSTTLWWEIWYKKHSQIIITMTHWEPCIVVLMLPLITRNWREILSPKRPFRVTQYKRR